MGLGWVFLIRGDAGWIVSDYRIDRIGWIVLYWLDGIVSSKSYHIIWILSGDTGFYALADLLLAGWDVGGTGVGWAEVSRRRDGSATIGS